MFKTCQNFTMKNEKGFYFDSLDHFHNVHMGRLFLLLTKSSNTTWKRLFECKTSVTIWPSCVRVATTLQLTNHTKVNIYNYNSYTIIYSYTVNVNLMLIFIELSELIIYCKYDWKFSVFEVIYLSLLYLFANPFLLNI